MGGFIFKLGGCNSMVECVLCTYKVVGSIPTISILLYMAYILRTHIQKKYLFFGLKMIYGIGASISASLCHRLGFQKKFLLKNLTEEDIYAISQLVDELKFNIKGDLERWLKQKVDFLSTLKTYRGIRHRQGLPVRGQRTHTNASTPKKLRFKKS